MKKHWITVAVIVAGMFVASLATVQASHMLAARPVSAAVVNVAKIYNSLKERDEIDADLTKRGREFKAEDDKRQEALKAIQDDLKILPLEGAAYKAKKKELEHKAIELQAWREYMQRDQGNESAIQKEGLYRKIVTAVGDVAKLDGFDMVLYREPDIDFGGATAKQLDALIALRKVLWCKDDLDITDRVIQKMNNDFQNAK